jgi:hypothetical protein
VKARKKGAQPPFLATVCAASAKKCLESATMAVSKPWRGSQALDCDVRNDYIVINPEFTDE